MRLYSVTVGARVQVMAEDSRQAWEMTKAALYRIGAEPGSVTFGGSWGEPEERVTAQLSNLMTSFIEKWGAEAGFWPERQEEVNIHALVDLMEQAGMDRTEVWDTADPHVGELRGICLICHSRECNHDEAGAEPASGPFDFLSTDRLEALRQELLGQPGGPGSDAKRLIVTIEHEQARRARS